MEGYVTTPILFLTIIALYVAFMYSVAWKGMDEDRIQEAGPEEQAH